MYIKLREFSILADRVGRRGPATDLIISHEYKKIELKILRGGKMQIWDYMFFCVTNPIYI